MSFTRREPEGRAGARRTALTMSCLRERRARPESRNRDRPRRELLVVWGRLRAPRPLGKSISRGGRGGRGGRGERLSSRALRAGAASLSSHDSNKQRLRGRHPGVRGAAGFHSPPRAPRLRVQCSSQSATAGSRGGAENAENGLRRRVLCAAERKRLLGSWMARKLAPPPESRRREQSSAPPRPSSASA
jgi:hypothetical protein